MSANDLMNCFKMTVDMNGIKKLEEYISKLEKENAKLKKQLDYLRSGEYYNQLRFENEMLQQVVDTNGVPSEVYDYIDCTHRNTELLEENEELKKQLEEVEFIVGLRQKRNLIHKFDKEYDEEDKKKNPNRNYAGIMPDAEEVYRRYYTMKNQQKEFIKYLKDMLDDENDIFSVVRVKDVLQKYEEIIGGNKDEY